MDVLNDRPESKIEQLLMLLDEVEHPSVCLDEMGVSSRLGGKASDASFVAKLKTTLIQLESELAFQRRSMEVLLSMSESGGNPIPLDQVFQQALRMVPGGASFGPVFIRLYNEEENSLTMAAQQGLSAEMLDELAFAPMTNPMSAHLLNSLSPVSYTDLTTMDPDLVGKTATANGFRSVVCVPLVAGEKIVGTLELGSKNPDNWSSDELRWLALVGRIIGSTISHVRFTEQLRAYAAVQERCRVAQELHDGLVQQISSIRVWTEAAQESIEAGDFTSAQDSLAIIDRISTNVNAGLRDEILGLRDTLDAGKDMVTVIRDYLKRFQEQWGIAAKLEVRGLESANKGDLLSQTAEIQVLRIIQESLTNVRKHAQATQATLRLTENKDNLRISIQDNGLGFVPEDVTSDHLGLNIMKERAASVHGTFMVKSQPGSGTKILIEIPKQRIGTGGTDS